MCHLIHRPARKDTMKVKQLSARIDQQLATIDARLEQLDDSHSGVNPDPSTGEERLALQNVREKLVKSREIVWRAHELRVEDQLQRQLRRTRQIGLALCIISGLAIVSLIGGYLLMN